MYINGREIRYSFFIFIVFFIITRQVPFADYSIIANVAVLLFSVWDDYL